MPLVGGGGGRKVTPGVTAFLSVYHAEVKVYHKECSLSVTLIDKVHLFRGRKVKLSESKTKIIASVFLPREETKVFAIKGYKT